MFKWMKKKPDASKEMQDQKNESTKMKLDVVARSMEILDSIEIERRVKHSPYFGPERRTI